MEYRVCLYIIIFHNITSGIAAKKRERESKKERGCGKGERERGVEGEERRKGKKKRGVKGERREVLLVFVVGLEEIA